MENRNHHGQAVLAIAKQKGFNKTSLSNALNMSRQGLEYHLKREFWNKETLEDFAKVLEVDVKEIVTKTTSESKETISVERFLEVMDENRKLWSVIARHGISVNFNGVSGFATVFLGLFFWLY